MATRMGSWRMNPTQSSYPHPKPVLIWPASETETIVTFDRPLDPKSWIVDSTNSRFESGRYVTAGDQFETIRPGYKVVGGSSLVQIKRPSFEVSAGAAWTGRSSTVLSTVCRNPVVRGPSRAYPCHLDSFSFRKNIPILCRRMATNGNTPLWTVYPNGKKTLPPERWIAGFRVVLL